MRREREEPWHSYGGIRFLMQVYARLCPFRASFEISSLILYNQSQNYADNLRIRPQIMSIFRGYDRRTFRQFADTTVDHVNISRIRPQNIPRICGYDRRSCQYFADTTAEYANILRRQPQIMSISRGYDRRICQHFADMTADHSDNLRI